VVLEMAGPPPEPHRQQALEMGLGWTCGNWKLLQIASSRCQV